MSEYAEAAGASAKLVAVVSRPPRPLHLVTMAQDLMRPKWYFGRDGREVRTAVIRNVKDEMIRSETRWIFVKGKSAEELQQQGCSRMVKTTPAWQDPVWLGILRQTGDMYRVAG